ncbi:hypothetical protein ACFQS7_00020 [Dankookia sp. GCM10030260]|uniref:hypothetical protein n=1 Tax=Dankookia sp. GCM10030260 TaxID=3273390 RepID=UPI00361D45BF
MFEDLFKFVDKELYVRSGSVFYTGRNAFRPHNRPGLYVLGLNPGGNPADLACGSISSNMESYRTSIPAEWSAYVDEHWAGGSGPNDPPRYSPMQIRVQHLFSRIERDIRMTPASNIAFERTANAATLEDSADLFRRCWPVHQAVIEGLQIPLVVCLGGTAGAWVREKLEATQEVGSFVENNNRRWTSLAHRNAGGLHVLTLTHPSRADWTSESADPTPFVKTFVQ